MILSFCCGLHSLQAEDLRNFAACGLMGDRGIVFGVFLLWQTTEFLSEIQVNGLVLCHTQIMRQGMLQIGTVLLVFHQFFIGKGTADWKGDFFVHAEKQPAVAGSFEFHPFFVQSSQENEKILQ